MNITGYIVAGMFSIIIIVFLFQWFKNGKKVSGGGGGGVTPKPTDESIETKIKD